MRYRLPSFRGIVCVFWSVSRLWRKASTGLIRLRMKVRVELIQIELRKVQRGDEPDDWKPFDDVGAGTKEIRIKQTDGSGIHLNL